MTRDIYYEEELRYLKEEGARFARKHPQRAKYLNVESAKDRDPRIETLFEGFAFLCAGIRERIDGVLPELALGLTGLLWPQLLHPVPSICVAEFKPRPGMLQKGYNIRKGTAMFTDPDPATGVSCRFATTRDVCVNPITVGKAGVTTTAGGKDVMTLSFNIEQGIRIEALSLSPLRIFINDDLPAALFIRKMLLRHVESVILRNDRGQSKTLPPNGTFVEGGFGEDEDLFPETQNVSRPLSLLRDYFSYPEKFLFIDILGLDSLPSSDGAPSSLTLEIRFDGKISDRALLTGESVKLHCAPAVNVFRRDAEPILIDGRKREYHLISDSARPECYAIHSVESVTGINAATGERREYDRCRKPGGGGFYSVRAENYSDDHSRFNDGRRLLLSMNGPQMENGELKRETLHVETWQTNGTLARKILAEGGALRKAQPEFPDYVTFANITIPSRPVNPPHGDKYLWAFLSHLSCTHTNFKDAEKLKEFLRVYDWTMSGGRRPEIEAITSVSARPCDIAVDRTVMRGTEMEITVDESAAPEENIFLMGTVLAGSLSCMVSINTFLKLKLTMPATGKSFVWHYRSGKRWELTEENQK